MATWEAAVSALRRRIEDLGVMAVINGLVGNNTHRKLAHELAHVWLGSEGEGVSGFEGLFPGHARVERFCDQAGARGQGGGDCSNNQNTRAGERLAAHVNRQMAKAEATTAFAPERSWRRSSPTASSKTPRIPGEGGC